MQELLKKDLLFKIAAVFLALLLWFYVTNLQNPILEKTITGVQVNYGGLQEGLVLGERTQTVEVKVRGPHSAVNLLTAKDIKVNADLSKVQLGESSLPVDQVTVPTGVEVLATKPQSFHIYVDAIKEKQVPVKVEYLNSVSKGYTSYDAVISPSIVVVRGANQLLSNVENARVTVDLNQAATNLALSLPVQLIDKESKPVSHENMEVSPDKIQVFVPVVENTPTKTVVIKPIVTGSPREGFVVTRVVVEPETMKITGPAEIIDKIDQINTRTIDVTGRQENMIEQVGLDTPQGVSLLYQPTAKVLIQIEEAPQTKTFTDIPITLELELPEERIVLNNSMVAVTVKGSRADIENLKAEDIHALVDLKGLNEGTYKQEVKIDLPANIQVVKVEPSTAEIVIKP